MLEESIYVERLLKAISVVSLSPFVGDPVHHRRRKLLRKKKDRKDGRRTESG